MSFDCKGPDKLFECRQCGDCCKGYGGTYLSEKDILAISRFIGSNPKKFVAQFCKLSGKKPLLAQGSDGYCIFWNKICSIHPVKPRMCRKWPFIESVLVDGKNWLTMADSCPGINVDVPVDVVQSCVQKILTQGQ